MVFSSSTLMNKLTSIVLAIVFGFIGGTLTRPDRPVPAYPAYPSTLTMPYSANGPYDLEHFNMTYMRTHEPMSDPALVLRANGYIFESSDPLWLATITRAGISSGIDANDLNAVTRARLHIRRGAIRIDADIDGLNYSELFSDVRGLWVRFPSGHRVLLAAAVK